MRKSLFAIFLFSICCCEGIAQTHTIKTFTRNDAEIKTEIFNIYNGKETYSYYEDDNGNYVKNGAYSLTGTVSNTIRGQKVTETYKATATFKDDLMNGTLSILYTGTGVVNGKPFNVSKSFVAGYSKGIPHGKWTWKDNTQGVANSSEMTFTQGVLTGLYKYSYTQMNSENLSKEITKLSGQLTAKGEFDGTWSKTESFDNPFGGEKTISEYIFSKGILLSCIKRDGAGKLLNPDQDRANKKALSTKYANGEITEKALYEQGYVFQTGEIKLYCPDLNDIGGDKLGSVVCGKPFLELVKVKMATDSLMTLYEEKTKNDLEKNFEWIKGQNKYDNTDRMGKVKEYYSFEHFYKTEQIGASLSFNYERYYLNPSQMLRLDSLKNFVDNRVDSVFKATEAERIAEKQKKEAEEQRIAAENKKKEEAAKEATMKNSEKYLNYGLSGIVSTSRNPTTKVIGFDMAIRNKCNLDENWRSVFYTEVNSVRYKKPDGSYGIETPQEVKLKSLFHNLHPITSYKILSYDVDEKGVSKFLVEFEQKNKKKEPSKFFQGSIYVAKNGAILLDYSLADLQEVTK